jgi:hypothetical protein
MQCYAHDMLVTLECWAKARGGAVMHGPVSLSFTQLCVGSSHQYLPNQETHLKSQVNVEGCGPPPVKPWPCICQTKQVGWDRCPTWLVMSLVWSTHHVIFTRFVKRSTRIRIESLNEMFPLLREPYNLPFRIPSPRPPSFPPSCNTLCDG